METTDGTVLGDHMTRMIVALICVWMIPQDSVGEDSVPVDLLLEWSIEELPPVEIQSVKRGIDRFLREQDGLDQSQLADLYMKRAYLHFVERRNPRVDLTKSLQLNPHHDHAQLLMGLQLIREGKVANARRIALAFGKDKQYCADYLRGLADIRQSLVDLAIPQIDAAIKQRPHFQDLYYIKAVGLIKQEKYAQAESALQRFKLATPSLYGQAQAYDFYMGNICLKQNKFRKAHSHFRLAARKSSTKKLEALVGLFVCSGSLERSAECNHVAQILAKEHRNHPLAVRCQAANLAFRGQPDKAIQLLVESKQRLAISDSSSASFDRDVAFYRFRNGEISEALEQYDKQLALKRPGFQTRLRHALVSSMDSRLPQDRKKVLLKKAELLYFEFNSIEIKTYTVCALAVIAAQAGEFATADDYVQRALRSPVVSRRQKQLLATLAESFKNSRVPKSAMEVLSPLVLGD